MGGPPNNLAFRLDFKNSPGTGFQGSMAQFGARHDVAGEGARYFPHQKFASRTTTKLVGIRHFYLDFYSLGFFQHETTGGFPQFARSWKLGMCFEELPVCRPRTWGSFDSPPMVSPAKKLLFFATSAEAGCAGSAAKALRDERVVLAWASAALRQPARAAGLMRRAGLPSHLPKPGSLTDHCDLAAQRL